MDQIIEYILKEGTELDRIDLRLAMADYHADVIVLYKEVLRRQRSELIKSEGKKRIQERIKKLRLRVLKNS